MPKKMKKGKKVLKKVSKKVKCDKPCRVAGPLKVSKPFNKSQIATAISDMICLSKKDANGMLDALFEVIAAHLRKRGGPGEFTLPNVAKFRVINKPATKARQGINPFTGESMMFAAKPARNIVKIRALKKIKDIAK
jgi:nucleoid DNA-binding protein